MNLQLDFISGRCYRASPLLVDTHDPPLVIYAATSRIHLVSLKSGQLIAVYAKHSSPVVRLNIHEDKITISSFSEDGYISTWNVDSLQEIESMKVNFPVFDHISIVSKPNLISIVTKRSLIQNKDDPSTSQRLADDYIFIHYDTINHEMIKPLCTLHFPSHCIAHMTSPDEYIIAINRKSINFIAIENEYRVQLRSDLYDMNCLTMSPSKKILATGHGNGAITLWYDVQSWLQSLPFASFTSYIVRPKTKPVHTVLHWHAIPLNTLCFNPDGKFLYSGGEEGVLVQWNLNDSHKKTFLPRLGAPIASSCSSNSSTYTAICTTDNCIRIIDTAR